MDGPGLFGSTSYGPGTLTFARVWASKISFTFQLTVPCSRLWARPVKSRGRCQSGAGWRGGDERGRPAWNALAPVLQFRSSGGRNCCHEQREGPCQYHCYQPCGLWQVCHHHRASLLKCGGTARGPSRSLEGGSQAPVVLVSRSGGAICTLVIPTVVRVQEPEC